MFQDGQEHKGLGTTQKMSANPPYCVLKNVKVSQKKMRCFKGLCFQLWVFIEQISVQFLAPSVQFLKGFSE